MAQNVSLWGATYSNVPALEVPKQGGGTATFTDVTDTTAGASDVASGKYFYTAAGVKTAGTGSGGGGGSSVQVGYGDAEPQSATTTISFMGIEKEPTSFVVYAADELTTGASPFKVATVVYDGTNVIGQIITNTNNAQVSYDSSSFSYSYDSDDDILNVYSTSPCFQPLLYFIVYSYDGTAGDVKTADVQVGSGATSITFTGLEDEPLYWSCIFKSNFSTSNGYQRVVGVIGVVEEGENNIAGLEMDSSAKFSDHWTSSYNNGSLTITSQGTNAGGYFHQPGYYQLTYAISGDQSLQTKTVTPDETTQDITADAGYTALKKVVVNPIPPQYIVPTGNYAITSNGSNIDIAQYATVSVNVPGGGGVSTDTKTVTASNYPVSLEFTSMKGQPKMFTVRLNAQVSSSGSTTYYYIVDITSHGTTTHGNCFRIGSTRRVDNITSGYSWSYSGTTLTITSSASSRSASPGAFYSGSYELMYVY